MNRKILIVLMLIFYQSYIGAHELTLSQRKEIKDYKKKYEEKVSSNEAKFDLAICYAYSGLIQKGWDLLKTIPKEHADDVLRKYELLISKQPNKWKYHFKLGFAHYFKNRKKEAILSFEKALQLEPNHPWILGFIALVYGDLGSIDKSIDICKRSLQIEYNAPGIHFLLGEAYRRKGKYFAFAKEMLIVSSIKASEDHH